MRIELRSPAGELIIDAPADWASCWFVDDHGRRFLGAESLSIIRRRLAEALAKGPERAGSNPEWILSLAERHHVLYLTRFGGLWALEWQDAESSPPVVVATHELDDTTRREWLAAVTGPG